MASWTFSNIVKDDSLTVIVGISLASAIAFSTYYLSFVAKVPNIHCGNKKLKSLLLSRVPCLSRRYWVTPWCIEPRLHTILSMPVFHTKEPISYEREILVLHDGGEVALDWKHKCLTHSKGDPILILLPGLTGDSQTFYVRKLVQAVSEAGWCCVVFQNRGLAGVRLKTPRTYCAANFEDFKEVLDHVVKKHPESPLAALGVSLGGLILGNYLCVAGENTPLTTAVIISAPWDVFISSESLQKPWMNRALNQHLAKALCNMYLREQEIFEAHGWDSKKVLSSRLIKEFDANFTAPQFGFASVDEYYKAASLRPKLCRIRIPVLGISAEDDPFLPLQGIPIDEAGTSSHIALVTTAWGGHIAFMEGLFPASRLPFHATIVKEYLSTLCSSQKCLQDI